MSQEKAKSEYVSGESLVPDPRYDIHEWIYYEYNCKDKRAFLERKYQEQHRRNELGARARWNEDTD